MTDKELIQPHYVPSFNLIGLASLTKREIMRFISIYHQSLLAPTMMSFLFYTIFSIAMGGADRMITIPPYETPIPQNLFMIPGLAMMALAQAAFMNASGSLVVAKVQGNIVDLLMPPLSPLELTLAYTISSAVRGLLVGGLTIAVLYFFSPLSVAHIWMILFFSITAATFLGALGFIVGIWAAKFDQLAAIQNFFIAPATFLSGVFYTSDQLEGSWQLLVHLNPFFYMIDGFRTGFIDKPDSIIAIGVVVMILANIITFAFAHHIVKTGWRLKS